MSCPWPGEPFYLRTDDLKVIESSCGAQTAQLVEKAKMEGLLDPQDGLFLEVSIRCSYQEVGEFQHWRDAWHYDSAEKGWIYVLGTCPTEFREGDRVWSAEPGKLTPYHGLEHRCPPQTQSGWRYFMRILWCELPCKTVFKSKRKRVKNA